jgi:hypothetical protein
MEMIGDAVDNSCEIRCENQVLGAASGILCWQVPDGSDRVDMNAGFMGIMDAAFYFGLRDGREVFCGAEYKIVRMANWEDYPWEYVCGALPIQAIHSGIAHGARMVLALTNVGGKVFMFERAPTADENDRRQLKIFMWPPGREFFQPHASYVDKGLQVIAEIVRISTAESDGYKFPERKPRGQIIPTTEEKLNRREASKRFPNVSKTGSNKRSHDGNQIDRSNTRANSRTQEVDEKFVLSDRRGESFEVTKLSLKSRFTPDQLKQIIDDLLNLEEQNANQQATERFFSPLSSC